MPSVVIENPILNSPFEEPSRHFKFTDDGITDEIVEKRRVSSYFIPIAQPKKKGKQGTLAFDTEWTEDRIEENEFINRIRGGSTCGERAATRASPGQPPGSSNIGTNPDREKKLFFCQIEALETAIYITEAAKKYGDAWIENDAPRGQRDSETRPLSDRLQDGDRQRARPSSWRC